MQEMNVEQVKRVLAEYYDIPTLIKEELETIRNCESERLKITLPAVNVTGMPTGKGVTGDQTANTALRDAAKYYDDEIVKCKERIYELTDKKDWCEAAFLSLDHIDLHILELAYMGPREPKKRAHWIRKPQWKQVCYAVNMSSSRVRERAAEALKKLSKLSKQQALRYTSVIK